MKIGYVRRPHLRLLEELNEGDTFFFDNVLYMKTGGDEVRFTSLVQADSPVVCVHVNNGTLHIFEQDYGTTVEAADMTIIPTKDFKSSGLADNPPW